MSAPLRIGTLGAARITPNALLRPARSVDGAEVVAVAARDPERARRFAAKHGIARVAQSYEALIEDPELDAIYNPLPNSHHCEWTVRALEAGKHVLCEKPLASNADEAQRMTDAAARADRVLMEAFHWRYHPLAARMREVIDSGELGRLRRVEATMCVPMLLPGDIRYRRELAGGASMDLGCYVVSIVRFLAGAEPEVLRAEARLSSPDVDRFMHAELRFGPDVVGHVTCSLLSPTLLKLDARVVGEGGVMRVRNPVAPQLFHRLEWRNAAGRHVEKVAGEPTYTGQLRAFVAAVRDGASFPTDGAHGVANMRVIDAIYTAAGLRPRGT